MGAAAAAYARGAGLDPAGWPQGLAAYLLFTTPMVGLDAERSARQTLIELAELVVRGVLDPCVTATYPLERAADALDEVQTGHVTGKVVITVP